MAISKPNVTAMDNLMVGFRFIVTLQEFTFGFQSVSGLEMNKNVEYISEGGVNDHQIMVGMPSDSHPTLTFRRGMVIHKSVNASSIAKAAAALIPTTAARKMALLAASAISPQAALEAGPAVGTITVFDRYGKKIQAMYSFLSLGMISWKGDDLDATSGSIWCEDITIAHTGLTRLPLDDSIVGSLVKSVSGKLLNDEDTSSNASAAARKAEADMQKKKADEELKKAEEEKKELEEKKKKLQSEIEEEKKKLRELEQQLKNQKAAQK